MGDFYILRDQLWWQVREWLRTDPGAMLPPDEMLIEELTIPTYQIVSGKIRIMKKDNQSMPILPPSTLHSTPLSSDLGQFFILVKTDT